MSEKTNDNGDINIPRKFGYIFMAGGAVLLGMAFLWIATASKTIIILGPLISGALLFFTGLVLLTGFYVQKYRARKRERIPEI